MSLSELRVDVVARASWLPPPAWPVGVALPKGRVGRSTKVRFRGLLASGV